MCRWRRGKQILGKGEVGDVAEKETGGQDDKHLKNIKNKKHYKNFQKCLLNCRTYNQRKC